MTNFEVLTREEVIEWAVKNVQEWPDDLMFNTFIFPKGWKWSKNGVNIMLTRKGQTGINKRTWEDIKECTPQAPGVVSRDDALKFMVGNFKSWPSVSSDLHSFILPTGWTLRKDDAAQTVELTSPIAQSIISIDWLNQLPPKIEGVTDPLHYLTIDEIRAIELIAAALTLDEWRGYCLGNNMKYRLRAGKKDDLLRDIGKADEHNILFERYKLICRGPR